MFSLYYHVRIRIYISYYMLWFLVNLSDVSCVIWHWFVLFCCQFGWNSSSSSCAPHGVNTLPVRLHKLCLHLTLGLPTSILPNGLYQNPTLSCRRSSVLFRCYNHSVRYVWILTFTDHTCRPSLISCLVQPFVPVSYTHLDVYKRQKQNGGSTTT